MVSALLIVTGYDPEYLRIVESIALGCRDSDVDFRVLDLTPVQALSPDSIDAGILRFGGIKPPQAGFKERIEALGGVFRYAAARSFSDSISLGTSETDALEISVQSALITFTRTDTPNLEDRRVKKLQSMLLSEGKAAFVAVSEELTDHASQVLYLPNGRFPSQRLAGLAAAGQGLTVLHFEKGARPGFFYLRPYSPHSRLRSQADANDMADLSTKPAIMERSDEWLRRRLPSASSLNEFSHVMKTGSKSVRLSSDRPKIGFFTSSQDEFLFLGPEWQLHAWQSQEHAFGYLMDKFEKAGYSIFLRVHPNLSTKSHPLFRRERASFRRLEAAHPGLQVFWHNDAVNSYDLLRASAGVVVWDSTIGLEASAQGIPVWTCAAAYYSQIADVREVFSESQATSDLLNLWDVDPMGARKFVSYLIERDAPHHGESSHWEKWNHVKEPMVVKIAKAARTGGAPTRWDAVVATFDLWRHRGIRQTYESLKSRLLG